MRVLQGPIKHIHTVIMMSAAKPKLRILVVAPSFDIIGGQTVQAARLIERLRQEPGLEVGFLPINPRLPGALRKLQAIKYVRTVVTSIAYIASLLNRVRKYDVLHVFSASYWSFVLAPTPAMLIGKLYGKKILLNYHSGEADDHLQRWRSAIPTIRLADELVVPSPYLVRVFAKFGLVAKPIYNLIDNGEFHFRERDPLRPVFLSNRNFELHYGVDRVLHAFAEIQKRIPESKLIVAGDGPERASLYELARKLELRNTDFTGKVDHNQIVDLYDATDIFINGSEIDNQPLSILEAFACGLPVVTTDAGGIPDMVVHNQTALVSPRGDFQQLASNAIKLLEDPNLTRGLIAAAVMECENYQWPAVRDQWLDTYYAMSHHSRVPQVEISKDEIPFNSH
jgi:glycosyltransferase involved in cell wall biosynthesis